MALTGDPRRWASEPGIPGVVHILDPWRGLDRGGWQEVKDALADFDAVIQFEGPQTIAAFFLEPVTGTNGILVPPDGYMQGVRDLCTK
jgi:taurine--2-oxoglutarate transaminase